MSAVHQTSKRAVEVEPGVQPFSAAVKSDPVSWGRGVVSISNELIVYTACCSHATPVRRS